MRNDIFHLGKSGNGNIYHCSTPLFNALKLIEAYGGKGVKCETVGEFNDHLLTAVDHNDGITLIEVPTSTDSDAQSHEILMLNLYIQAQNGNPVAMSKWQEITQDGKAI